MFKLVQTKADSPVGNSPGYNQRRPRLQRFKNNTKNSKGLWPCFQQICPQPFTHHQHLVICHRFHDSSVLWTEQYVNNTAPVARQRWPKWPFFPLPLHTEDDHSNAFVLMLLITLPALNYLMWSKEMKLALQCVLLYRFTSEVSAFCTHYWEAVPLNVCSKQRRLTLILLIKHRGANLGVRKQNTHHLQSPNSPLWIITKASMRINLLLQSLEDFKTSSCCKCLSFAHYGEKEIWNRNVTHICLPLHNTCRKWDRMLLKSISKCNYQSPRHFWKRHSCIYIYILIPR